jgi:DNA-binding response OmpR family regulator
MTRVAAKDFEKGVLLFMNILVVEGDVSCAQLLGKTIIKWGHPVEKATSGKEALKRFNQKNFDLVLLNVFLPDMEGYELIAQLKELCPKIGIVTMTEHNSRELELKVRRQGILYYMIKPAETKHLKSLLDHVSKKRGQQVDN